MGDYDRAYIFDLLMFLVGIQLADINWNMVDNVFVPSCFSEKEVRFVE